MDAPPPARPPPLLSPEDLHHLCCHGYTALTLPPELDGLFTRLCAAANAFFAQPQAVKDAYKPSAAKGPPASPTNTERGYTHLPGEKEYLTLRRSLTHLPPDGDLPAVAAQVWHDTAHLLHRILADVGVYLGLGPHVWDPIDGDSLTPSGRAISPRYDPTTILRLFRYLPGGGGAEPHGDLGLLTLCVCWGPGLQVRPQPFLVPEGGGAAPAADTGKGKDVEPAADTGKGKNVESASASASEPQLICPWIDAPRVTVMTGDTLHVLTSQRVPSAVHRVVMDGPAEETDNTDKVSPPGRRSIVFALRATTAGVIDLAPFGHEGSVSARELYDGIRLRRVNINQGKDTRAAMRAQLREQEQEQAQERGQEQEPASAATDKDQQGADSIPDVVGIA